MSVICVQCFSADISTRKKLGTCSISRIRNQEMFVSAVVSEIYSPVLVTSSNRCDIEISSKLQVPFRPKQDSFPTSSKIHQHV